MDPPRFALPLELEPMEAEAVHALPEGERWQFEPKWDGFRCLVYRRGGDVELMSRSGRPLTRFFPEVAARVLTLPEADLVLDSELVVPRGPDLSFDALQARLHPAASRIRRLSLEAPGLLVLFDVLAIAGRSLLAEPLNHRRDTLERLARGLDAASGCWVTPCTTENTVAAGWLESAGGSIDGIVAKELDGPYRAGERAMLKVKHLRSADCVVGGFRYGTRGSLVGSLLLGLYAADGRLDHVGYTASLPRTGRPELTRRLEALAGGPGFTGDKPAGPSRWNPSRSTQWTPVRPELVVEVCYDHVSSGRFRHGTRLLRFRPDKAPRQCTRAQLEREAAPGPLHGVLSAGSP